MNRDKNKVAVKIEKVGLVIGDKTNKTRVVQVEKVTRHPLYKKSMKKKEKFYAHDEENLSRAGDVVKIRQTRPMSKLKRWRIMEILKHIEKSTEVPGAINGSVTNDS